MKAKEMSEVGLKNEAKDLALKRVAAAKLR
jgi:hypothetical protein